MSQTAVNLSQLAIEQLTDMPPIGGRAMSQSLKRLTIFPESAPQLTLQNYEAYRQLLVRDYRAIYRYLPALDEVRVYCIIHVRRRLPSPELLQFQEF